MDLIKNIGLVEAKLSEVRFKGNKEKSGMVYQGYEPLQATDIAETTILLMLSYLRTECIILGKEDYKN